MVSFIQNESESEVTQSCLTLCNPMDCSLPGSSNPWDFPGKSTGVGCHFLLQGIFPTQGLKPGLCIAGRRFYCLSHQGSSISRMTPPSSLHLCLSITASTNPIKWNWTMASSLMSKSEELEFGCDFCRMLSHILLMHTSHFKMSIIWI